MYVVCTPLYCCHTVFCQKFLKSSKILFERNIILQYRQAFINNRNCISVSAKISHFMLLRQRKNRSLYISVSIALQMEATVSKRWNLMRRSWTGLFFQILIPMILTIVLLLFNNLVAEISVKPDKMFVNPWNTSIQENIFFYKGRVSD